MFQQLRSGGSHNPGGTPRERGALLEGRRASKYFDQVLQTTMNTSLQSAGPSRIHGKSNASLTGGRLLARNTIWNLLGQLLPMAVGVVAIPPLVRGLGIDRFGLLSLVWIVIGYFSLFDLGMGRALTKLVADKLGANEEKSIPPLAWTSLLLMFLVGVLGSLFTLLI